MRELNRFLRGMVAWVGYPQMCVRYERQAHAAGVTKYPLRKMIRLAWTAAISFSPLPLRLSFLGAGLVTFLAIEETVRAVVEHLSGRAVPGWASLMVVVCLSNAALMIAVGLLGEYAAKMFEESKGCRLHVVADTWNLTHRTTDDDNVGFQSPDTAPQNDLYAISWGADTLSGSVAIRVKA
jgi:hypothetical protein